MPNSWLSFDIDKCPVYAGSSIVLGVEYEIRTRSLERVKNPRYNNYQNNSKWKRKWKSVVKEENSCQEIKRQFLNCNSEDNPNTYFSDLKNALGLKLNYSFPRLTPGSQLEVETKDRDIFYILYTHGIPVAMWFRDNPKGGNSGEELNNLLGQVEKLTELPSEVLKYRQNKKSSHLSLLWDDPNRVIPNYQLR